MTFRASSCSRSVLALACVLALETCCLAEAAAATTSYTTDFNLLEAPISESGFWKQTGLHWTKVHTAGGLAHGTQSGNGGFDDSYAYLSGFPPDQSASGVVHISPNIQRGTIHEVEILLRWSDTASTARGYECNFAYDGQYADIIRWNGPRNSFSYLVPTLTVGIPGGLHEGDVVSAKMVGKTITTYVNGKQLLSVDDDMFMDGNPGIGFFRGGPSGPPNDFAFTRFTANAVSASAAVPMRLEARHALGGVLAVASYVWARQRRARQRHLRDSND